MIQRPVGHRYFTSVPQKSFDACFGNGARPNRLVKLLFALVVDPDEAGDAFRLALETVEFTSKGRLPGGLDLRWFIGRGSMAMDSLLLTISQWILFRDDAAESMAQIAEFDRHLGAWVGCELAKRCPSYKTSPNTIDLLSDAQEAVVRSIARPSSVNIVSAMDEYTDRLLDSIRQIDGMPSSSAVHATSILGADESSVGITAADVASGLVNDMFLLYAERSGRMPMSYAWPRSPHAIAALRSQASYALSEDVLRFPR